MADGTNPQTITLVGSAVSTVTLDANHGKVEVLNVTGTAAVYFTLDSKPVPTVAGDGAQCVPAIAGAAVTVTSSENTTTVVKLISSGTPQVHVRGVT